MGKVRTDESLTPPEIISCGGDEKTGCGGETASIPAETVEGDEETEDVLGFLVAGEAFGIGIMRIKEILKPRPITEVPRAPSFLPGIISLRGAIVPVFDLRIRLGLEHAPAGRRERLVVVKTGTDSDGLAALLVDQVLQVVSISGVAIESLPPSPAGVRKDFIEGVGRSAGRIITLLNPDRLTDLQADCTGKGA